MTGVDARAGKSLRISDVAAWDFETDVAVVGYGGAGACAAIAAADEGARVMLLELASEGGGSTRLSSGELYLGGSGGTAVQRACGFEDSTEDMANYLRLSSGPQVDDAKVQRYSEDAAAHFDWLVSLGVPFKNSFMDKRAVVCLTDDCLLYTGSEKAWPFSDLAKPCPRGHNLQVIGDEGGPLLMDTLGKQISQRDIDVHMETRALTLITDDANSSVLGLLIRKDMREYTVRAHKGVVLCAGGFVMNDDMLRKYAPALLQQGTVKTGNPGDMGSGILMGMSVGGAAINMHEGFVSLAYYPPAALTKGIFVNAQGQRFINEDCYHGRVGAYAQRQFEGRTYLVFSVTDDFKAPAYLNAPVAGTGETIEELAEELGLPDTALKQTLDYYNHHAQQQKDPLFNKAREFLTPLEAPYAALDCTPGNGAYVPYFTLGGLDTSVDGEVLRPSGSAIPGLYAAGRTSCGLPRRGEGYASGLSVGDATFFGRRAGRASAKRVLA